MKTLLTQTFAGAVYSLGLIRGCEFLAGFTEKHDGIVRLILFLSTIACPFLFTKLCFNEIKKY
jgi:hypothetical protein